MTLEPMRIFLLAVLALLVPGAASACVAMQPSPQDAARGTVLVGYVTGVTFPDWEASLIKDGPKQYALFGRRVVRVTFIHAITGDLTGPLEVATPCYDSSPKLGDRAIVVASGTSYYVMLSTPEYEGAVEEAARGF